jgi:hypothetical protein
MTQQADMIRAQARQWRTVNHALLKTARSFAVQQKVRQSPLTVGTQHDRQHTDLAGTAAKRPSGAASSDQEADRVMTDRDQLKITFDSDGTAVPTGTA